MEYDDRVMCSLIDEKIDPMECVDVVDCVLNPLFLNSLPEKYKAKENFKDIEKAVLNKVKPQIEKLFNSEGLTFKNKKQISLRKLFLA